MPEFKPKLSKDIFDVSNFNKIFTSEEVRDTVLSLEAREKIKKRIDKFHSFD